MKLRIRENSLRIRITQSELDNICTGNSVVSNIQFPNETQLIYRLSPTSDESTSIRFEGHAIQINLGQLDVNTMSDPASIGVQSVHQTKEKDLNLLIEKDFACLHPRGKEDEDTFPNPSQKEIA